MTASPPPPDPDADARLCAQAQQTAERLLTNVRQVVRGKDEQVKLLLAALASPGGHVLLEDVPGTAKTVLARALAASIKGGAMRRIQCTPDLLPSDVTGISVFDPRSRAFEFRPGPVLDATVCLVDEINRALPKTQSALLEAMAEGQVTVDGVTRPLQQPFLVIATANPVEQEGTFPLPEAQLDRFFLHTTLGYPDRAEELAIVEAQIHGHPLEQLRPVVTLRQVAQLGAAVERVYVRRVLRQWIVDLVRATRSLHDVELPASVRGTLALERAARAWALLHGRDHVVPEDVLALFGPVIGHRLLLSPGAQASEPERRGGLLERCLEIAPRPEPQAWARVR